MKHQRRVPLGVVVLLLVIGNVVNNRLLPKWAYVPWNLTMVAVLLVIVARTRLGRVGIGLARGTIGTGARFGIRIALGVAVAYLVAMTLPATRDLFDDQRVSGTALALAYHTLARIPVGTVLLEELAFRGVLPGLFRRGGLGRWRAYGAASVLFGAWHILPAWNISTVNPVAGDVFAASWGRPASVALAVAATTVAGFWLCWVRERSNSLVAPFINHVATNSLGYLAAFVVTR